jgi:hypothetical protein
LAQVEQVALPLMELKEQIAFFLVQQQMAVDLVLLMVAQVATVAQVVVVKLVAQQQHRKDLMEKVQALQLVAVVVAREKQAQPMALDLVEMV